MKKILARLRGKRAKKSKKSALEKSFKFAGNCDYSLIIVGAHNGRKTESLIQNALGYGKVALIEPTPFLFQELVEKYGNHNNVDLFDAAIVSEEQDTVEFFAMKETSKAVSGYGDMLGSLNGSHAAQHNAEFIDHLEKITVKALTIRDVVNQLNANSIDVLMTDIEGHDINVLMSFPFDVITPRIIIFEHKHSDGVHNIGTNFANWLIKLEQLNYSVRIIDVENAIAIKNQ